MKPLPVLVEAVDHALVPHAVNDDIGLGLHQFTDSVAANINRKKAATLQSFNMGCADHLLSRSSDAIYVAHVIAAWAGRRPQGLSVKKIIGLIDDQGRVFWDKSVRRGQTVSALN